MAIKAGRRRGSPGSRKTAEGPANNLQPSAQSAHGAPGGSATGGVVVIEMTKRPDGTWVMDTTKGESDETRG